VGGLVNLERAMGHDSRYGGHFVQGHVDTTATIASITPDSNSLRFLFHLPPSPINDPLMTSLIPKGYIALDGTSLTLTSVSDTDRTFGVMLIAHTQDKVVLPKKKVGDRVNVEIDMVAKGIEKMVRITLQGWVENGGELEKAVKRALEEKATSS